MADLDGYGTILSAAEATATSSATAIGGITNITGPSISRDAIDVSDMSSTSKIREFIPGLIDGGEITCTVNYDGTAAGTADKLNTLVTHTSLVWYIKFNDHTTEASRSRFACPGFVTGLGTSIPNGDKVTQDVTIKVSGQWTFTDLT